MNKLGSIALLCCGLLFAACHKHKATDSSSPAPTPAPTENPAFKCQNLPPVPVPFGWHDTTTNVDQNINTFMFNPANPDEVIIVVNGDMFGFNKMLCYNVRKQTATYLATLDSHLPSVNQSGWVVYSTVDNNIFKVKCNGDSLTQLTFGNTTSDPKWDYTGNGIYYYQAAFLNVPSQLMHVSSKGAFISNMLPAYMANTAIFKNSDKIIYQRIKDNSVTLVMREMATSKETVLISGPYTPGSVFFDDLCLDNTDQNFYWTTPGGIVKCSLATLKIDTLLKTCQTIEYMNPVFQQSRPSEILVGCHFIKPITQFDLLHEYKAVEYDLISKEKNILDIYP